MPPVTNFDDNPDVDFLYSAFNLHDLGSVRQGLRAGASIQSAISIFSKYKYDAGRIADAIEFAIQQYETSIGLGTQTGRDFKSALQFQPDFFGGPKMYQIDWPEPEEWIKIDSGEILAYPPAGRPEVAIGSENETLIPCSPTLLSSVKASLLKMRGTTPPIFWQPNPSAPYTFTPDMAWISTPEFDALDNGGAMAAFEYLGQAFNALTEIIFTPTPHDLGMLLGYGYELLSRFYGVTAVGANLTEVCIAASKFYKTEFGVKDIVSATPIDPISKRFLKDNSTTYTPIPFPRIESHAWLLMLQGDPVFLPYGDPRSIAWQSPESLGAGGITGRMTINQQFADLLYRVAYPSALAAFAALGGNKNNLFYYPTPDVIPDQRVTLGDGSTVTIPGGSCATMLCAPLLQWKNPDGTFALPVPADNNDWNDLEAGVSAGKFTELQIFNLCDQGIGCDPALRDVLWIEQDPDVIAAWDASHKNAKYLRTFYQAHLPPTHAGS